MEGYSNHFLLGVVIREDTSEVLVTQDKYKVSIIILYCYCYIHVTSVTHMYIVTAIFSLIIASKVEISWRSFRVCREYR